MFKVIFLDIDGVLNLLWRKKWDKQAVNNLNTIIILTGAKIVVSSSWRCNHTIEQLREIFKQQGIVGEIIGITPVIGIRGLEILKWIELNKPDNYVVVDDKATDIESHIDPDNFFKVDQYTGLKDIEVKVKIIMKLAPATLHL